MRSATQDPGPVLLTPRLRLRPWSDDDLGPFAAMSADPQVMRHMPGLLDRTTSDELVGKLRGHFAEHGFGLWAVDLVTPSAGESDTDTDTDTAPATARGFIGFVGLSTPHFDAPFTPCVEIGWRLASAAWGHGYATEAARAALRYGFLTLGLEQIVSFTVPANLPSIRLMERLGMSRDPAEDFDHPRVPLGDRLCRHVLFRLSRAAWAAQNRV